MTSLKQLEKMFGCVQSPPGGAITFVSVEAGPVQLVLKRPVLYLSVMEI